MASGLTSNAVGLASELSASSSLPASMNTTAAEVVAAQETSGWLGLFGWLVYTLLNTVSTILYWALRITTISVPSILFKLFSTSWTITMNATTLWVLVQPFQTYIG